MKRLLMALVVLTGLIGAGGAVWAQDLNKGMEAYKSGDYVTALKEWRPLADQGNAAAQYNLAFIYNYGNSDAGVTQDDAEAVKWFRKAAEQGNAGAQYSLGVYYLQGKGVVSRSWWKFAGGALRAGDCWPCQAARSRVAGWIG